MNPTSTRAISTPHIADWRTRGACLTRDPEFWFPKGSTSPGSIQAAEAKAICRTCPVAITCAAWAIEKRLQHGIYGGLDAPQRRSIARKETRRDLTHSGIVAEVRAAWASDERDPLVETYLSHSVQDIDGHVWWRGRKTSYPVAGRDLTPGQIAYELKHKRAASGHVTVTCDRFGCVAAEHLADGIDRWQRDHATAA
ncbi:WhiB family transcriptional regulator [Streptomyces sp. MSC1_001]|jgi:WhiB family redox-sensing transcriptional regulator|uniref:WhiB family transcriptional regulator n=1 Tax=Streptomyces sp. MSC1_001 TaxID=2909263 RepID=UPI00203085CF|nr:WhiB family transcriptional regulator [Streptomyces sp. MSC1_001]